MSRDRFAREQRSLASAVSSHNLNSQKEKQQFEGPDFEIVRIANLRRRIATIV